VLREVIDTLQVQACGDRSVIALEPGTLLTRCRIIRSSNTVTGFDSAVYVMAFAVSDRDCTCPLVHFLPRTQTVEPAVETNPGR
jgi:hypothetical protein